MLLLSSCTSVNQPVGPKWPNVSEELRKKCENLKTITEDKVSISDMLKVIVENYTLHHECSIKVDGWNEWYDSQKKVYETIIPDKKTKPWYNFWSK